MKKLFTIVLAGLIFPVFSQTADHRVNSELAGVVAAKIMTQVTGAKTDYRTLQPFIGQSAREGDQPAYYVVEFADRPGYVLVSGTRLVTPVIGFSLTDPFDTTDMPRAMKAFLRNWAHSINRVVEAAERDGAAIDNQALRKWNYMENNLLENDEAGAAATIDWDSIPPLIVTKWGQRYPYNAHCPIFPTMGRSLAGCGPIAMAQVLRYHEHTDQYDWSQMVEEHSDYNSQLAELIADCGDAAGTGYSTEFSPTVPWEIDNAFQSAFSFRSARYDDIPNAGKKGGFEYTIKNSLENGCPVIIDGYEEYNIFDWHIFIMDGYYGLSNGWMGWFHINWGWSGGDNGWFHLEDCNPPDDPGPYNYNQGIVWKIIPPHKVTVVNPVAGSTVASKTPVPIAWLSEGRAADMQHAMIVIFQENYENTVTGHNELNYDTIFTTNQPGQNIYMHQFDSPNVSLADSGTAAVEIILYGTYGDNAKYRFFSDKIPFYVRHGEFMVFTSPVSGTNWQANLHHTVSWDYNENTSPTFSVKYRKVSGPSTAPVSGQVVLNTTENSCEWLIPAAMEGTYYLEGYKWGDPQLLVHSDHFTIGPKPTMDVTLPQSNQQFHPGNTLSIRWTSNASENFRIILQRWDDWDPGDTLVLAASTPNDGEFDWLIPDNLEPGILYSVVVKGTVNPQILDGVFYFEIRKRIAVTAPAQSEEWEVGKPYYIEWTDNFSEKAAISLYRGTTYHSSVSDSTESDGSYMLTVSDTLSPGVNYRIRVHMLTDTTVADYSDFFSIIPARVITVSAPAPNAAWQAGQSYNINWTTNVPSGIKIELIDYSQSPHQSTLIHNGTYPPYSWAIPSGMTIHDQYKIRLSSVQYPAVVSLSNFFSIVAPPQIQVTSPTAVTSWPTATTQTITWTDNLSGNVNIYLYRRNASPGFIATLASGIPSTGSYTWFIPQTYTPSNDYYLIVRSVDYPTIQDASDDFTISQGNFILVTTPSLGAQWEAGSKKNIYWDDNIPENVIIILQKYGMGISDTITHSTYSDGWYSWVVPTTTVPGTNYNIKILSVSNPGIFDISDPFEIYNTSGSFISVTSPTADSVWKMGTQHTITWDDNISGAVTVHLYKGGVQAVILSAFNLNSSLTFTVPTSLTAGTDYQAKVTSVSDPAIFDFSPEFEITPADFIDYTGPGAFRMSDTATITWNDNIPEHVKIELFHADTLYSVITPSTPSDGEFLWGVPSGFPLEYWFKIKISRDGSPALSDLSGSVPVYFPYYLEVTRPVAGNAWHIDSSYAVQWSENLIN
ncbi:MAG: C10 family peptidase, partial [Bacteroidales bacterium]|nr:C10 family peptidase [Bacteroidales bacterium]